MPLAGVAGPSPASAAALAAADKGQVAALAETPVLAETAVAALRQSEQRLLMAQENAHVGIFDWDLGYTI